MVFLSVSSPYIKLKRNKQSKNNSLIKNNKLKKIFDFHTKNIESPDTQSSQSSDSNVQQFNSTTETIQKIFLYNCVDNIYKIMFFIRSNMLSSHLTPADHNVSTQILDSEDGPLTPRLLLLWSSPVLCRSSP